MCFRERGRSAAGLLAAEVHVEVVLVEVEAGAGHLRVGAGLRPALRVLRHPAGGRLLRVLRGVHNQGDAVLDCWYSSVGC